MHVADVGAAVGFFVDVLGFTAPINGDRYAYVERDGAGIRIQWHDDPCELEDPHGCRLADIAAVAAIRPIAPA